MTTELPILSLSNIIQLNSSPNKGDIAITSINDFGTEGELNSYVLEEYGYSKSELPSQKDLINGTTMIKKDNSKPILFVVTVNGENVSANLEKNLFKSILSFRKEIVGKKLWIPLMGVGVGNLSVLESYKIIVDVINKFVLANTTILLSIPNTKEGVQLFNQILNNKPQIEHSNHRIVNFAQNFSGNFYCIDDNVSSSNISIEDILKIENYPINSTEYKTVSRIKKNDIIIIKNVYVNPQKEQFIKIKSIGLVKEKSNDKYDIELLKIQLPIDINNLDFLYSKHPIKAISKNNIITLLLEFTRIDNNITKSIFLIFQKEKIAGLISDSDDGIDYLEIDKDVNAFAKVIAAKSFQPPLAIALFGKWGSGKSFFMRQLKNRVNNLSKINNTYCEGVVQIHFNAWSYMDSNLWASIVTRIFEELNVYISKNTRGEEEKKQVEKQLTNRLSIAKEEIGILKNKKEFVKKQIHSLEKTRDEIAKDLEEKIKKIKSDTIWKTLETVNKDFEAEKRINNALHDNDSYKETSENLKKIIPEDYWKDPEKTYQLVKSKYTFLREFFRKDKLLINTIWLLGIIALIIAIPLFIKWLSISISKTNFIIPQATFSLFITLSVIWKRAESTYNQLQPFVSKFWKIKEDYEEKIKEATSKFEQEQKALKLEIEKGQSEILLISEKIQKAETIKTDLEFRINNALATETLYSFIDKRSKSDDYHKHLGIISIIRKDFEILSDLFVGHHEELNRNNSNENFKSKFTKPLQRIILYIDDLDRCPEENVVEVLEAVNLLMAFPLFVVVAGVDSRWVKNALYKKHIAQFDNSNKLTEVLEVSNYLEKIFQIPFHLKDASDNSVKDMIKNLAQNTFEKSLKSIDENLTTVIDNKSDNNSEEVNIDINVGSSAGLNEIKTTSTDNIHEINSSIEAENLILTEDEIQIMQDMSEIIGNNPRCIKRFVNIFRVIKAHEDFDYSNDSSNEEIIVILFLIALPLGKYKKLVPSFEHFIDKEHNSFEKVKHYFQFEQINEFTILKDELQNILLNTKSVHETLLNMNTKLFKDHNKFIQRFTFSQI